MAGENLLVVDDNPTILKVVESALARAGYQVDTALDVTSGMELARTKRPAVILIDSLIPAAAGEGEGGLGLCGALADDLELSQTPVVLMTSKVEDQSGRYARTPNVIDYITKPFSSDAVLAVVSHVIEKTGAEASQATRAPGTKTGDTRAVAEALSRSGEPPRADPLERLTVILAERLERFRQESAAWEIPAIVRGALKDGGLAALLAEAGYQATDTGAGGPDLSGHLGAVSMSEVLLLLGQQGQTGTLRVLSESARVDLFFRKGVIDLAAAVGVAEEFLLGRFAVEAGDLAPADLAKVLEARARVVDKGGKPPLFGRDLILRGLLTEAQLKLAMRRQTSELTYETLRWSQGTFQFRRAAHLPEIVEEASLGINIDTLLLEGFRRIDEWRLIERDIRNFDMVFVRDEDRIARLPRGTLTRDEIAVLDAMSGKSTVRDVIRTLRLGSFDVSKILYRLLHTKLIRPRVDPTATP